jgi:hypothetical protein
MKKHLDKEKKCIIINNNDDKSENQLYLESLIPIKNSSDLNIVKQQNFCCEKCNYKTCNKSNLVKHIKNSKRCKKTYEKSIENNGSNTTNNTQNINIVNSNNTINNINNINNININVKSLNGFDEDWNISNITDEMKKKLLLNDSRFTNTLKSILENNENLNVILTDETTGFVYKFKNNEYEAMHVNNIFDKSMDKIYKHLRDFFQEMIEDENNDKDNKNIIKEINNKYYDYKKDFEIKQYVDNFLTNIFNDNKEKSIEKCNEIANKIKENNEIKENNNKIIEYDDSY